jgi:hypothetical protein
MTPQEINALIDDAERNLEERIMDRLRPGAVAQLAETLGQSLAEQHFEQFRVARRLALERLLQPPDAKLGPISFDVCST